MCDLLCNIVIYTDDKNAASVHFASHSHLHFHKHQMCLSVHKYVCSLLSILQNNITQKSKSFVGET